MFSGNRDSLLCNNCIPTRHIEDATAAAARQAAFKEGTPYSAKRLRVRLGIDDMGVAALVLPELRPSDSITLGICLPRHHGILR